MSVTLDFGRLSRRCHEPNPLFHRGEEVIDAHFYYSKGHMTPTPKWDYGS